MYYLMIALYLTVGFLFGLSHTFFLRDIEYFKEDRISMLLQTLALGIWVWPFMLLFYFADLWIFYFKEA